MLTLILFMLIMLGALGISLVAGWVAWQRHETALTRRGVREAELELYAKVRELRSQRRPE
jgi:CHASE3 domain sensor protein